MALIRLLTTLYYMFPVFICQLFFLNILLQFSEQKGRLIKFQVLVASLNLVTALYETKCPDNRTSRFCAKEKAEYRFDTLLSLSLTMIRL